MPDSEEPDDSIRSAAASVSSYGGLIKSMQPVSGMEGVIKSMQPISGFGEAMKPIRSTDAFEDAVKSVRATTGLSNLAHQIAVKLSGTARGQAVVGDQSSVLEPQISDDDFVSTTVHLGSREWVFIVALAEVVRRLALEQSGVTETQAALIMVTAIWLLANVWSRPARQA